MNEKDLEKRLRSVVSGSQPLAPPSLRHFLRELPESGARRYRGPLGALRHAGDLLATLAPQTTLARRLEFAGALALALAIAIVGSGLLIALRQAPRQPVGPNTVAPTTLVTPRTTTPAQTVVAHQIADNPYWYGTTQYGNLDEALPVEAAILSATMESKVYVGISAEPYGLNGVVHSANGLFWDWSPVSEVDAGAAGLTSITADTSGRLVIVGWADAEGGAKDGRAYYSDDGKSWSPAADQSVFAGVVLRKVVSGFRGFVALGWNDAIQADAIRPVSEWFSPDGRAWTRVSGVPVVGTSAMLSASAAGFILSGTPLKSGNADQPPIWYSVDGSNWQRATATDAATAGLGPLVSLTLLADGTLIGLCQLADGSGTQLVQSTDGGLRWQAIKPEGVATPNMLGQVASVYGGAGTQWLIATYTSESGGKASLYVSGDAGRTWKLVFDSAGSPLGTVLVELGTSYGASNMFVLAYGKPESNLGIWLASGEELTWS
jgi:hypothetical protein